METPNGTECVSPDGHRPVKGPLVELTQGGGCSGCLYMKALLYLLNHATGSGRLVLRREELDELGLPDFDLIILKRRDEHDSRADPRSDNGG